MLRNLILQLVVSKNKKNKIWKKNKRIFFYQVRLSLGALWGLLAGLGFAAWRGRAPVGIRGPLEGGIVLGVGVIQRDPFYFHSDSGEGNT